MTDTIDRVMVDIETLGIEPGVAISSIGAVRFDRHGPRDGFSRQISLESCQAAGLTIDAETLTWWLDEVPHARAELTTGAALATVLDEFADWYGDADEIWANSPSFDCEHLEVAYDAVGETEPWHFQDERCFRTLRSLVDVDIERDSAEHDALDDATYQARVAAAALDELEVER